MLENHGDDDAGEANAVRQRQSLNPSDQEIATHEACAHYPYRDWCRACIAGVGWSDAHKRQGKEQNGILVASMDDGFFTDGQEQTTRDDGDVTKGATPFL